MHSILSVIVLAALAYVGTMFDNFFAFAAQLLVTEQKRLKRVSWAQALGVGALILMAGGIGSLLAPIPLPWIGILCLAPWALGIHAWRERDKPPSEIYRRGAITTFVMTLALGGDNIAVWVPLLRANGVLHAIVSVCVFAVLEFLFIVSARALTRRPKVVEWGSTYAPRSIPWIYFGLGVLILIECGSL